MAKLSSVQLIVCSLTQPENAIDLKERRRRRNKSLATVSNMGKSSACPLKPQPTGRRQRERERERERVGEREQRREREWRMEGGEGGFAQEPGQSLELDGWPVTSLHSGG
ncbi:hypothetical protein Q8A73_011884 [Channa argus]|nr:hypothetical protein Q8A73_011884 [Channa argus]